MYLAKELLHQIADQNLSHDERAELRCRLAKQLEDAGNYEGAREAMSELWQRVGDYPALESLNKKTAAKVLLRVGALTGWIGSAKQIDGAQEAAKNLLSESIALFRDSENASGVAEAQIEIAVCYWRAGAFDEARVMLQEALSRLADNDSELRGIAMLRSAIVEGSAKRLNDSLRIYTEAAPLFEKSNSHVLKGKFHHGFGYVLKNLGAAESRKDYIDRALIEYAAASFFFEEAGLSRYQACVENNLGFLFCTIGRLADAHGHLDRAQALLTQLKDRVHLAQADETRARVMLAEGRIADAEKLVSAAVRVLEKGGEQSLFAEALSTHGIALARLRNFDRARVTLERAIDIAQQAGDLESAGNAALVIVEELRTYLSHDDLKAEVDRARELLADTQDASTSKRLAACACEVLSLVHATPGFPPSVDWTTFSFWPTVLRFEAHFIKLALKDAGGIAARASRLLGFNHHQSLLALLKGRHVDLRPPVSPRRRSIIKRDDASASSRKKTSKKTQIIRILHVEDDSVVANVMKETLALEGWEVEMCAEGTAAMAKITSHTHYDLLLLDYDLPGVNGVQLIQQARRLAHRRAIPIIILSATLDETAAREACADASLRKPEDISAVAETVTRLLRSAKA